MLAAWRGEKLRHSRHGSLACYQYAASRHHKASLDGDGESEQGQCCLSPIEKKLLGRGAVAVHSPAGHTAQTPISRCAKICRMQLNSKALTQGRPHGSRAGRGERGACLQRSPALCQKLNKQCHRKAWEIQQMPEIRLPNLTAA